MDSDDTKTMHIANMYGKDRAIIKTFELNGNISLSREGFDNFCLIINESVEEILNKIRWIKSTTNEVDLRGIDLKSVTLDMGVVSVKVDIEKEKLK